MNILLKQKQSRIIIALKDTSQSWYISSLAKACDTTYVHACNFLAVCESMGITQSEKHGKLKVIKLTEKGLKLAEMLASVNSILAIQEQQQKPEPQK
jgi:predicted transcriptional regulator